MNPDPTKMARLSVAIAALSAIAVLLASCSIPSQTRVRSTPATSTLTETTESPDGTKVTKTGTIRTASKSLSGGDVEGSLDTPKQSVRLGESSLEVGGSSSWFSIKALDLPGGQVPYLIVGGILFLGLAGGLAYYTAYRASAVFGAIGLGLIVGAFWPPAFVLGLVALLAGVVFYYRDAIAAKIRQATIADIVPEVDEIKEKNDDRETIEGNLRRRMAGPLAKQKKREVKRARRIAEGAAG